MIETILSMLQDCRIHPQALERDIQNHIQRMLEQRSIPFDREFVLGPRNRVDFLCDGGIAIELKKGKPGSEALAAQAARYATFDAVTAVVLVVERCVFDVPEEVNGKPIHYVALNRNWGIAL